MRQLLPGLILAFLAVSPDLVQAQSDKRDYIPPELAAPERVRLQPLADMPLRDAAICKGLDGAWYLTGTTPSPDGGFQINDGISLWRSEDFKTWKPLGAVWSIARDATGPRSAWQKEDRINPDNPSGPLVRGMVAPEIHAFRNTYWITYSMNGRGTGLLRSKTGRAEGPYEDLGKITDDGTDASLFADEDGSVYWVVGQGWIARMKPDMTALAEPLRLLTPAPFPAIKHGGVQMENTHSPRTLGQAGAHLFKANGKYWLTAATVRDRLGVGCWDTFVCGADSLDGPFSSPMLMVPHGGQTTVFEGPDQALHATFAGRDSRAAFRDRPGAVPLVFSSDVLYGRERVAAFPRKKPGVMTEFGPWAKIQPAADIQIRDLQFSGAPDGFHYLTGSGVDNSYAGKIMVFRSKDFKSWEPVDVRFDPLTIPGFTQADYQARFEDPKQRASLGAKFMDSEIYFFNDTFHIFTSLYRGPKLPDGSDAKGGGMWLRSTTGRPEGPYEYVDEAPSQCSAFRDKDGKTYLFYNGKLEEWDPGAAKRLRKSRLLQTEMGTDFAKGDVATNLALIDGKYVVFATGWCGGTYGENYRVDGTYDWVYWESDTLDGPYQMPRRVYAMPHAGHSCPPVQGPDGRWFGLLFGNDSTGPWWCTPGVLVYDIRRDPEGTLQISLKDETP